jgi:hypothetical protein
MKGFRPPSPAANRGTAIHKQAELYLLDEIKMYPPELQPVAGHAMKLKTLKANPERKLAVKEDWSPCDFDDPDAYFRGVIDISYLDGLNLHIEDWKTGQIYPEHAKQMEQYIALTAPHYPQAEKYITRIVYIDQGVVTPPKTTLPERLKPIRLLLDGSIHNAETDEIFPVRPGPACKWCEYGVKYGGPCPHGR